MYGSEQGIHGFPEPRFAQQDRAGLGLGLELIRTIQVKSSVTSIRFGGLNGDRDGWYLLLGAWMHVVNAVSTLTWRPNGVNVSAETARLTHTGAGTSVGTTANLKLAELSGLSANTQEGCAFTAIIQARPVINIASGMPAGLRGSRFFWCITTFENTAATPDGQGMILNGNWFAQGGQGPGSHIEFIDVLTDQTNDIAKNSFFSLYRIRDGLAGALS